MAFNRKNKMKELNDQKEVVTNKIIELEKELRKYISIYSEHCTGLISIKNLVNLHDDFFFKFAKTFIENTYDKDIT